jgi:hypothetical protein
VSFKSESRVEYEHVSKGTQLKLSKYIRSKTAKMGRGGGKHEICN